MADESGLSAEAESLSTASLWKGENDSDAEQMETYDSNPLALVSSSLQTVFVNVFLCPRVEMPVRGRRRKRTQCTERS